MIERPVSDLRFVRSGDPIPTVEVDLDSIPEALAGYSDLVARALQPIASKDPKILASLYVYQGPSVNFGTPTFSAFIGVAGPKKLLEPLLSAFRRVVRNRARFGDYINPSTGICEFHIQDGYVWRPIDASAWYAESANPPPAKAPNPIAEPEGDSGEIDSASSTEIDPAGAACVSRPARFRAARADATVGSIRRTIEEIFGLPEGSVALCGPDGKALRADATIATLRQRWE